MSRARFWKLQLNLDTFNSAYAALDGAEEQASFLTGLSRGMNGGKVKEDCADSMAVGFAIGSEMREEAEGFRASASANGSKRKSNENHRPVHHPVDQSVHHSGHPILNPQSNNLKPKTEGSPSRALRPAKKAEPQPIPAELTPVVEYLSTNWPTTSYGNGDERRSVQTYSAGDLWNRVTALSKKFGKVPGAILFCGVPYLRRILKDAEDSGKARFAKDMSNFWGIKDGNRYWEEVYTQGLADYTKFTERGE